MDKETIDWIGLLIITNLATGLIALRGAIDFIYWVALWCILGLILFLCFKYINRRKK